jgi:exodeoxyribonuclease VII small subunit
MSQIDQTKEKKSAEPTSFAEAMTELESLNQWFQQDDLDLELGLEKLQRSRELISYCQKRLAAVETEFLELKQG